MKYLCTKTCQVRLKPEEDSKAPGKILMVKKGEVHDSDSFDPDTNFKGKSSPWSSMGGPEYTTDFGKATDAELMEAKWDLAEATLFVKRTYGVDLVKASKKDVVGQILDARFRHINVPLNNPTKKS
jgi:hypothetical protein